GPAAFARFDGEQVIVAVAFCSTTSLVGDSTTGGDTFNVAPSDPAVSSADAGVLPLGDRGVEVWRPHAIASARSADTPVTTYILRSIRRLLAKETGGRLARK